MNLVPLFDRVFVKRELDQEKTPGGIILPDVAKKKLGRGKVVAVGPGKRDGDKFLPMTVAEGDIVLFSDYAGNEIPQGGENSLLCLTEDSILAIVK